MPAEESVFHSATKDIQDANPVCQKFRCSYRDNEKCTNEYSEQKRCVGNRCMLYGSCIICSDERDCKDSMRIRTRCKTYKEGEEL